MAERAVYLPFTVSSGFWRSVEDAEALLRAGADKVAVNTAAVFADLVEELSRRFGAQATVLAVDAEAAATHARGVRPRRPDAPPAATRSGGFAKRGAGEILLTSMDRDGTKDGFDLALTRARSCAPRCGVGRLRVAAT